MLYKCYVFALVRVVSAPILFEASHMIPYLYST